MGDRLSKLDVAQTPERVGGFIISYSVNILVKGVSWLGFLLALRHCFVWLAMSRNSLSPAGGKIFICKICSTEQKVEKCKWMHEWTERWCTQCVMLARAARSSTEAKAAKDTKPAEESKSSAEAPKPKVTIETRLDQFLRTHCGWEDALAKEKVKSAEVTKPERKPADEAKPAEESKPAVEAPATEETKPSEEAKPSVEAKPAQEAKPVEASATVESKPAAEAPATAAKPAEEAKPGEDAKRTEEAAPKRKGVLRLPAKTPAKEEVKSAPVASVASRKRSRTRSISI